MTAPDETERFIYFVLVGIQRSYYLNEDKQYVIAFAYAPSFSGIPESFFTQTPSNYFLETMTYSTFLRLSFKKHQQLMNESRKIEMRFKKKCAFAEYGLTKKSSLLPSMDSSNFSKLMNSVKI